MGNLVLVTLVLLPALVGSTLLLAGSPADRIAPPVGVITVAALAGATLALALTGGRPSAATAFLAGTELGLAVDGLAAVVLPAVALVSLLVLVASSGVPDLRTARFYGLMLLFVAAAVMTVLATTLPALLMSWEVMGATSFALIGYHWRDHVAVASGTTAFLTTRTADLGLYVAAGAALAGGAGLGLSALPDAPEGWRDVVAAGLVLAGLGKAAQLPFSFWLSSAMHGPSPVSALLHSAAMVAMGAYLLLRVAPTLAATGWADQAAAWAGAVTAVTLGLVALAQRDLKQLLAASTAAQLGYVVLAAGVGATAAGTAHLVAHAAVKAGLFLAAGAWLQALGTKRLAALTGAARVWPVVGACSVASLLSLAGLPPLALWATKDAVLAAASEQSALLYVTGLLGAALSAGYAAKALSVLTRRPPERTGLEDHAGPGWDEERVGTREVPAQVPMALVPLAVAGAVLGALALPPLASRLGGLMGSSAPEADAAGLLVSGLLAAGVLAGTLAWMRRAAFTRARSWPVFLTGWLYLEAAAHRVVVRPIERFAVLLARLDDAVLDRGIEAGASWAVRLARAAALMDDRAIDGGVRSVAAGTQALGRLARRPQTGQLHQYYLQALTVLCAVLVVVVLVR